MNEIRLLPELVGRSIVHDADLSVGERAAIVDTASVLKRLRSARIPHAWLPGKTLGMVFQHPSTRTRNAFQVGMDQLGGRAIFLGAGELQLKRGESLGDTAAMFSRFVDAAAIRIADPAELDTFAAASSIPVFNALTSFDHPLEALSDVHALVERFGDIRGMTFAFVGSGNNMCHSLMCAMCAAGVNVAVSTPADYAPDPTVVAYALRIGEETGASLTCIDDPMQAVRGVNAVYTDVHESMGEDEGRGKLAALAPWRVTPELMRQAADDAVFMHCLPLHRGQEVDPEVADGPQSIIFDQAESRLHVHKAVLLQVLHGERTSAATAEGRSPC